MDKYHLHLTLECNRSGWFVTSSDPELRGLLVVGNTRAEVLARVEEGIKALDEAKHSVISDKG
ncbi:MAG TPA: hypothetical protein VLC51_01175 [Nitrospira sp.]|nr:hypothetical protein [Nitrospira sp.]